MDPRRGLILLPGRLRTHCRGRCSAGSRPGHAADWLSDRYRTSRPIIDEAAAAVGREPRRVRTVFNLPGRVTDRLPTATAAAAGSVGR